VSGFIEATVTRLGMTISHRRATSAELPSSTFTASDRLLAIRYGSPRHALSCPRIGDPVDKPTILRAVHTLTDELEVVLVAKERRDL